MTASRPPRSKKRAFHHGDLRNALVRATTQLLTERREVGSLSLREVAREAGVASSAPYHHFATRADLLVAVALEGFTTLGATLARLDAEDVEAEERLRRRVRAYMRFAVEHPAHYRVMFHEELQRSSQAHVYEQVSRQAFEALVTAVMSARPAVELDRARSLAWLLWSSSHGAAMLAIDGALEGLSPTRKSVASTLDATADDLVRAAVTL
ncbi:MAG: WHG domain-containing protein [Myxococcales bacterium]|nr:WHG domain-containing protein [Myxococcales bacterium]